MLTARLMMVLILTRVKPVFFVAVLDLASLRKVR